MKERPILFNAEMVKAVLGGRKIQTRRIIKHQPPTTEYKMSTLIATTGDRKNIGKHHWSLSKGCEMIDSNQPYFACPFGCVGDFLYVRETFKAYGRGELPPRVFYKASDPDIWPHLKWTPSIHMPREFSRINLEITDIRIERVQDIAEEDAENEGISFLRNIPDADETLTAKELFWCLWDSIYKNWNDNPWVWVVEFKVIQGNLRYI